MEEQVTSTSWEQGKETKKKEKNKKGRRNVSRRGKEHRTWLTRDFDSAGWGQIRISSYDIFRESIDLPGRTSFMAEVLTNETDPFFLWQYDESYPCPGGCARTEDGSSCTAVE